ncbi:hypothetical protein A3A74_00240 [Candidatus Roizmanbacteria bacterium RIFCSPLOWO2_01_FULL_35_13]|uniref:SIS domain-containing protein n=1 Tax=Candidatus Roizmanbacteria bacterium RIFCSPLOWO2_01_FULL_35_13 TaxID=1802055 RepID=A0A1F7IFB8_9BACT|nr:MAG: hypothetical protein A3A74_00240 [Candidatus Roizmanbacteria bacterium RIFCSPLOWO2_01_FULL_35_13]
MINLDNKEAILKLQKGDKVIKSIEAFPKQLRQSIDDSLSIKFPEEYKKVNNIVVCGMGGSRFTPLVVRELFKKNLSLPFIINDDYVLPKFVNENSLVLLSSYSGTTEEVVFCGETAKKRGAKLTGIASGGKVINFLKNEGLPHYQFNPTNNPSGQPRIGFGYIIGGVTGMLLQLNLLNISKNEIDNAIINLPKILSEFSIDIPLKNNPAKQFAKKIFNKYPYYVVSEFLTGVGNAIQNQTNENAKQISSFRMIPELNHHLMEGLKLPILHREMALFILFFSKLYSSAIQKRFYITKDIIEQNKIQTIWHELKGATTIEQTFELLGFGSFFTMYLSVLNNQNASLIPYVDYFKKKLKEMD